MQPQKGGPQGELNCWELSVNWCALGQALPSFEIAQKTLARTAEVYICLMAMQVVTIDAVEDVPGGNETALQQAVTMHPVGIGLCVGDWIKEWRAYTGGILKVPSMSASTSLKL